jgi:hypothetical protein
MIIQGFTEPQAARAQQALLLMVKAAPDAAAHVLRELAAIEPGFCGFGAAACTNGFLGRTARLSLDVEAETLPEVASKIFHEALHHWTDDSGQHWSIEHTCGDRLCSNPAEMLRDPIYLREAVLKSVLVAYEQREAAQRFVQGALAATGAGLVTVGVAAAARAIVRAMRAR